jgi:DNA polymerase
MMEPQPRQPLRATEVAALVLDWYRAMGVDAAVDDRALDWLARGDRRPGADYTLPDDAASAPAAAHAGAVNTGTAIVPRASTIPAAPASRPPPRALPSLNVVPVAPAPRQFPTATPDAATLSAREIAAGASDLDDLGRRLAAFDGCALKATAKSLCFYRGAPKARLMILGEAPGAEEDKQGKPFVGPAGKMLDRMLAAIDLDESAVHISNIVYWRPPGNRTPTPQEALVCRPFLERQVAFVEPEFLLLLGGPAANHIFDVPEGIMKVRGRWRDVTMGGRAIRALATLHPAYLLRTPVGKRMAWRDMLAIEAALGK